MDSAFAHNATKQRHVLFCVPFRRDKNNFLRRFVTIDETWICHFTPKANRQPGAHFEATSNSFYKKGIEMLEKRWSDCIAHNK